MKNNISKMLLIGWSIVSLIYIAYITWTDFKAKEINQAYQAGKADTIDQLIKQAQMGQCQPFAIYNGDNQAQLVSAACLPPATQTPPPSNKTQK